MSAATGQVTGSMRDAIVQEAEGEEEEEEVGKGGRGEVWASDRTIDSVEASVIQGVMPRRQSKRGATINRWVSNHWDVCVSFSDLDLGSEKFTRSRLHKNNRDTAFSHCSHAWFRKSNSYARTPSQRCIDQT